ncbi:MAG: hypothetical protein ACQCN6_08565 [Candidatus Bathyarchaeia archaeon]
MFHNQPATEPTAAGTKTNRCSFQIHTAPIPAWSHVERVEETVLSHTETGVINAAILKSHYIQLLSCGAPKLLQS